MSQLTVEEYLESIGSLEEYEDPVSTTAIARTMGVSLASVSEMVRRLARKGLVEYTPYGGARLTDEGRTRFLRLTRRHRLWEVFLNRYLGIPWDEVYEHACSLEHATSDIVADNLAEFLDNPQVCPHGNPIPRRNLKRARREGVPLSGLEPGQTAAVTSVVQERDPEFLRYLSSLGIAPGSTIKVVEKSAFDGTLNVEVNGESKAVARETSSLVMVRPLAGAAPGTAQSPKQSHLL